MYLPRGSLIQLSVSKPLMFVFPKYGMILVVISVLFIFWRVHKLTELALVKLSVNQRFGLTNPTECDF